MTLVSLVTLIKIFRLVNVADNCFKFYGRMLLEQFSVEKKRSDMCDTLKSITGRRCADEKDFSVFA